MSSGKRNVLRNSPVEDAEEYRFCTDICAVSSAVSSSRIETGGEPDRTATAEGHMLGI